jgi:hypothetical protein
MDSTAIFFWVGMVALLAVAVMLGRWQREDMARRSAETYGYRAVKPRVDAAIRSRVSSRDMEPPDAAFPDGAERASA